jgi:2-methylisocitrate lyase-like PEP mutase family enzyme
VREAIDSSGIPVVLTARCEAYLYGIDNPYETVLKRLTAFAEAGADCLFAPGVHDLNEIVGIVKAAAPKPVNVIVSGSYRGMSYRELADSGVRRISVGSALARTAWKGFMNAVIEIYDKGTFDTFKNSASFEELNKIFN